MKIREYFHMRINVLAKTGEKALEPTFLHALKLWLFWNVIADLSLVVFVVPIWIAMWLPELGYESDMSIFSPRFLGLLLGGILMGLIQGIAFMNPINRAYWWTLATALGSFLAVILLLFYLPYASNVLEGVEVLLAIGAIVGVAIGLPQWLVLRGMVPEAGWWLVWSGTGWACAFSAPYLLTQSGEGILASFANTSLGEFIYPIIGLLLVGMITGIAFAYLFSQPNDKRLS
jgi:hypothetical protein